MREHLVSPRLHVVWSEADLDHLFVTASNYFQETR